MLGYGSMIASSNTGKAAITKKYLGIDNLGDADNPLVYMTSAASSTTNTSALDRVPWTPQTQFNLFLQTANAGDQPNTRDDAGLPIVYGTCKLLDMLGYGSMIASTNTGKAAITKKYLGIDNLGDTDNPLVYSTPQSVNLIPLLAYQKIYYDRSEERRVGKEC